MSDQVWDEERGIVIRVDPYEAHLTNLFARGMAQAMNISREDVKKLFDL